eukprot:1257080-Prymnesium_polylepis.1
MTLWDPVGTHLDGLLDDARGEGERARRGLEVGRRAGRALLGRPRASDGAVGALDALDREDDARVRLHHVGGRLVEEQLACSRGR